MQEYEVGAVIKRKGSDTLWRKVKEGPDSDPSNWQQVSSPEAQPAARQPAPAPQPEDTPEEQAALQRIAQGRGNAFTDFLTMGAQGLSFGFADDIAGALGNEGFGQRVEDLRTLNPGASLAAEMAGGVALPFAGGAKVARSVSRAINPVAGAAAGGLVAGGGAGALTGAGEAESRGISRGKGALQGGLLGAAGGAVLGTGAGLAGAFTRALNRGGTTGAARVGARRELLKSLDQAGIDPDDIPRLLDDAGPNATIADLDPVLGGKAAHAVARAPELARTGAPGDMLRRVRPEGSNARLGRIVKEATGIGNVSDFQAGNAIDETIEAYRRATFDVLEDMDPVISSERLTEILDSDDLLEVAGRNRVNRAMAGTDGAAADLSDLMNSVSSEASEQGGVPFRRLQSIRQVLSRNVGNPDPGIAGAARKALDELDDVLADELPAFRAANQGYRRLKEIERALEDGYQMFNDAPENSAEQILARLGEFETDAARSAFRVGGQQALLNRLRTQGSGGSGASNMMNALGGIDNEIKLSVLARSGESLDEMLQRIRQEQALAQTSSFIPRPGQNVGSDVLELAVAGEPPVNDYSIRRLLARLVGTRSNAEREFSAQLVGETLMDRSMGAEGGLLRATAPAAEISGGLAAAFGRPAVEGLLGGNR